MMILPSGWNAMALIVDGKAPVSDGTKEMIETPASPNIASSLPAHVQAVEGGIAVGLIRPGADEDAVALKRDGADVAVEAVRRDLRHAADAEQRVELSAGQEGGKDERVTAFVRLRPQRARKNDPPGGVDRREFVEGSAQGHQPGAAVPECAIDCAIREKARDARVGFAGVADAVHGDNRAVGPVEYGRRDTGAGETDAAVTRPPLPKAASGCPPAVSRATAVSCAPRSPAAPAITTCPAGVRAAAAAAEALPKSNTVVPPEPNARSNFPRAVKAATPTVDDPASPVVPTAIMAPAGVTTRASATSADEPKSKWSGPPPANRRLAAPLISNPPARKSPREPPAIAKLPPGKTTIRRTVSSEPPRSVVRTPPCRIPGFNSASPGISLTTIASPAF